MHIIFEKERGGVGSVWSTICERRWKLNEPSSKLNQVLLNTWSWTKFFLKLAPPLYFPFICFQRFWYQISKWHTDSTGWTLVAKWYMNPNTHWQLQRFTSIFTINLPMVQYVQLDRWRYYDACKSSIF